MEYTMEEKIESLEAVLAFNTRLVNNMITVVNELNGARRPDTDVFLTDIVNVMNLVINVSTPNLDIINGGEERINVPKFNVAVRSFCHAYEEHDDAVLSRAIIDLIPQFQLLEQAIRDSLVAQANEAIA